MKKTQFLTLVALACIVGVPGCGLGSAFGSAMLGGAASVLSSIVAALISGLIPTGA